MVIGEMLMSCLSLYRCSLLQPVTTTTRLTVAVTESPVKQEILNTVPYWQTVPISLDFTTLIVDLVHQYAAQVHSRLFCVNFMLSMPSML